MAAAGGPSLWRPSSRRALETLRLGPTAARRAARGRARVAARAECARLREALDLRGAVCGTDGVSVEAARREELARPSLVARLRGEPESGAKRLVRNVSLHARRCPQAGAPLSEWRAAQRGGRLDGGAGAVAAGGPIVCEVELCIGEPPVELPPVQPGLRREAAPFWPRRPPGRWAWPADVDALLEGLGVVADGVVHSELPEHDSEHEAIVESDAGGGAAGAGPPPPPTASACGISGADGSAVGLLGSGAASVGAPPPRARAAGDVVGGERRVDTDGDGSLFEHAGAALGVQGIPGGTAGRVPLPPVSGPGSVEHADDVVPHLGDCSVVSDDTGVILDGGAEAATACSAAQGPSAPGDAVMRFLAAHPEALLRGGGDECKRSVHFGPTEVFGVPDLNAPEWWFGDDGDSESESEGEDDHGCCPCQVYSVEVQHERELCRFGLPEVVGPYDTLGGFLGFQPRGWDAGYRYL